MQSALSSHSFLHCRHFLETGTSTPVTTQFGVPAQITFSLWSDRSAPTSCCHSVSCVSPTDPSLLLAEEEDDPDPDTSSTSLAHHTIWETENPPCFSPVGTHALCKTASPESIRHRGLVGGL